MRDTATQVAQGPPAGGQQEGPKYIGVPDDYGVQPHTGIGPAVPPRYVEGDELLPASIRQEDRTKLINDMVDAGLLPESYRNTATWDTRVRAAYTEVLTVANTSGKDANGALSDLKESGAAKGEDDGPAVIGGNVGGGNVYTVKLSDPASLRQVAEKAARAVLGRRPKKSEMDAIVASIAGAEVSVQESVDAALEGKEREKFAAQTDSQVQKATAGKAKSPLSIISPVPGVSAPADTMGAARSGGRKHKGTDIFGKRGSPAVAPISGEVIQAGNGGSLGGLRVWIKGDDGRFHYLAHLDRVDVKKGQRIEQGAQIGTVGNTGNAKNTPAHVHYSINSSPGKEDGSGNPAAELSGGGHDGHDHGADVVQVPDNYIAPTTVAVTDVDPNARAEEYLRETNPVEAGAHDLAASTYGSFLSIIGAQ